MKLQKYLNLDWCKSLLKTTTLAILLFSLSVGLSGAWFGGDDSQTPRKSTLAQGDAITDPTAILRYSLPLDNEAVRRLQGYIEDISNYLRAKRWPPINKDVKSASRVLSLKSEKIIADVPADRQAEARSLLQEISAKVEDLKAVVEAKDKEAVWTARREVLDRITDLEELMVEGFPYEVPSEYADLPQLLGRATVKLETTKGDMTVVVDGYSAPVTAGNFVDLVERGFYDGLDFFNVEGFALQTGNPEGKEEGFIDPDTGEYRAIPLEVLVRDEEEPIYGFTLEEIGIYLPDLALPFNAYGAVALARPDTDPNGGSSQFFFFKFDTELTPPGFNLMDGRYAVFGYLVDGRDVLDKLTDGDKIIAATVVDGANNLVEPQA
ncbi:MAG: peptidylprolyl isomerase [Prochloraceae cyanobacterium]